MATPSNCPAGRVVREPAHSLPSQPSRWGPCEHMYACLEHEGRINEGHLPEAKRPAVHARPPARGPVHLLPPCCQGHDWIGLLILLMPPSRLFHRRAEAQTARSGCNFRLDCGSPVGADLGAATGHQLVCPS